MKPLRVLGATLFAAVALALPTATQIAAAPPTPERKAELRIAGSGDTKYPSVAAGSGSVGVSYGVGGDAVDSEGAEEAAQFKSERLGGINGNSTYFNTATAISRNGTRYFAWIESGGAVKYRSKAAGQSWSGDRTIAAGLSFANALELTAQGDTILLANWRDRNGDIEFAYSGNSGQTWSNGRVPGATNGEPSYTGIPRAAATANGPLVVTWSAGGQIYYGEWNGSNFNVSCVSCVRFGNDGTAFFQPSIAVTPDKTIHAIWYQVGGGIYYARKAPNANWGIARISGDSDTPPGGVGIAADGGNNVHLAWIGRSAEGDELNVKYVARTADKPGQSGELSNPIVISGDGSAFKANIDIAASAKADKSVAHVAWESFGGGQYIRYARVDVPGIGCGSSPTALNSNNATDDNTKAVAAPDQSLTIRRFFPLGFNQPAPPNTGCQ